MLYNKIIPIEGLDMQVVKSDVSLMFSRDADNNKTVTLGRFLGGHLLVSLRGHFHGVSIKKVQSTAPQSEPNFYDKRIIHTQL